MKFCQNRFVVCLRAGIAASVIVATGFWPGPGATASDPAPTDPGDRAALRASITQMKAAERGPFSRVRWFCQDGTVLPPKPYACKEHGGGSQHGEWTARVKALRARGYFIANVLADIDIEAVAGDPGAPVLAQVLIEQYLRRVDDGWIFRRARFYRGALQEEGERAGGRQLLLALLRDPARMQKDYAVVRTAARLLPHGAETRSATLVRQLSADLSGRDPGFMSLRNKVHVKPGPEDAGAVREYAKGARSEPLRADLIRLADAIEELYSKSEIRELLNALAARRQISTAIANRLRTAAAEFAQAKSALERYVITGHLLGAMRDEILSEMGAVTRLRILDASLQVEAEHFVLAGNVRNQLAVLPRRDQIALLAAGAEAIYGVGLIRERQRHALQASINRLAHRDSLPLEQYKREVDYLKVVPAWASQRLRFHFSPAMATLYPLEPKVALFVDDQLRGGPLFAFSYVLDGLARDANRLAGVRNELFGEDVGAGLRSLNPGLARGRLLKAEGSLENLSDDGIYILPETTSDLPPVAGILTAGEGNPLSHVQLLARNLGIPNVGVDESLLGRLQPLLGREVILAVSASGSVRLAEDRGEGDSVFKKEARAEDQALIRPNLEKLDLSRREPITLSTLRATDSGRTVGPKAAKLGELKFSFPTAVADGVAIPFGVFRKLLERPHPASGTSVFVWIQREYRRLAGLAKGSRERRDETERFRAELYDWILNSAPDRRLVIDLRTLMEQVFGADGTYGVFVRSDTNVEDLPGFTGAGLNLTVPNVVGVEAIIEAIPRVWASPFTARAFAWRQAHMDQPEHVYPAVLLLRSVPVQKSGVLVTQDIDTGASGWLSVAVNEGVGGAVDGQAAESLRIEAASGSVRLLAQATARVRREVSLEGGVIKRPVTDDDYVLRENEIGQLIELFDVLPGKFPEIVDLNGRAAPADIEFGFLDGQLRLFQIRPFLESARARGSAYLKALDSGLKDLAEVRVNMTEPPR